MTPSEQSDTLGPLFRSHAPRRPAGLPVLGVRAPGDPDRHRPGASRQLPCVHGHELVARGDPGAWLSRLAGGVEAMTLPGDSDYFWTPRFEIEIQRDGLWPLRWSWHVSYINNRDRIYHYRSGEARTKDRAQRKAAAARISIERDDLVVRDVG